MTEDEVRAAAERLVEFHERFAPLFGKEQAQDNSFLVHPDLARAAQQCIHAL